MKAVMEPQEDRKKTNRERMDVSIDEISAVVPSAIHLHVPLWFSRNADSDFIENTGRLTELAKK